MTGLRRVHQIAVFATTIGAGLAAGGFARIAFALIVLSILLLAWSLDRIRHELARREIHS